MHIASPPLWQDLLLENPWPVMIALVCLAAVLRLSGKRSLKRRRKRLLTWAAVVSLVLVGGVYALATLVVTGREQLIHSTRQLVGATSPLDWQRLDAMLAPGTIVTGPDGQPWLAYDRIGDRIKRAVATYGISEQAIRGLDAQVTGPGKGESILALSTTLSKYGVPVRTAWGLFWQKESDGQWCVTQIRWLEFRGRPPTRMW